MQLDLKMLLPKTTWSESHGTASPQRQLCMFSIFYLNSIWVKNGFIEGQQCSFNISFENVMSYSILSNHVGTATKTTKMSAPISEIKQTNYSFNISAFRSLPDNICKFILYGMLHRKLLFLLVLECESAVPLPKDR